MPRAFLRHHRSEIIAAWERAVAAERPGADLAGSALRASLSGFLEELATWLEGAGRAGTSAMHGVAARQAAARAKDAHQLQELLGELRLLRTVIVRRLLDAGPAESAGGGDDGSRAAELALLDAGLDHAIGGAVEEYLTRETANRTEVESALRDSERRYRTLFDSIDEGFCTIEVLFDDAGRPTDYRFLEVNGAFERHTGLVGATGRRMRELVPSHDEHWFEIYGRVASTGEPLRFENRAEALKRWYDVYAFRVGEPAQRRVAILFSDISERRRADAALRESEAALDAFFEASPGVLNLVDEELRYVKADAITPTYFGLTRHTIVGASLHDLAPEFVEQFGPMIGRVIDTGEPELNVEVQSPVPSRPGELSWWRASYFPVPLPGGKRGCGVMGVEITDLKKAEAALREADRRKDEFLGMLSHELRNPLAPIRNCIFILEHADPTSEQAQRARTVIHRQTEHLTRIVDDLLDVNRIARGKVELRRERADLREVVRRAAEDLRSVIEGRGVTFRILVPGEDVWADVDATRLAQVVGNLLHNAAKFTRRGDTVTVSVRAADGAEEISVSDTGAGIEPALRSSIFEPFVQGERTLARTQGGLGLGLALVKGIVELHGGTVRAESAGRGKGAEFVVRLPVTHAAVTRERQRAGVDGTSGRRGGAGSGSSPPAARRSRKT